MSISRDLDLLRLAHAPPMINEHINDAILLGKRSAPKGSATYSTLFVTASSHFRFSRHVFHQATPQVAQGAPSAHVPNFAQLAGSEVSYTEHMCSRCSDMLTMVSSSAFHFISVVIRNTIWF